MCGLIGVLNLDQVARLEKAAKQTHLIFEDQHDRGTRGFGLIAADDKGAYRIERATETVKNAVDLALTTEPFVFMHHRQPTSSDNKILQTHPLLVDNKHLECKYLVLHNGVIHNATDLFEVHESLNFTYHTFYKDYNRSKFNDSESLAIEVARYLDGLSSRINAIGSVAFIALKIDKTTDKITDVYFFRNGNPLKLSVSQHKIIMSSEGPGNDIELDTLYHFAWNKWKVTKSNLVIPAWESKTKTEPAKVGATVVSTTDTKNNVWHGQTQEEREIGFVDHRSTNKDPFIDADPRYEDKKDDPSNDWDEVDDVIETGLETITSELRFTLEDYVKTGIYPEKREMVQILRDVVETMTLTLEQIDNVSAKIYSQDLDKEMKNAIDRDLDDELDAVDVRANNVPQKLHAKG